MKSEKRVLQIALNQSLGTVQFRLKARVPSKFPRSLLVFNSKKND